MLWEGKLLRMSDHIRNSWFDHGIFSEPYGDLPERSMALLCDSNEHLNRLIYSSRS